MLILVALHNSPRFIKPIRYLPGLLFLASAVVMYLRFREAVIPDAIAYLSVTERIMMGDFAGSVNGYWSPLVSWLLVPLCTAGIPGILAFQLLNMVFAAICLYLANRLLLHFKVTLQLRTAALCGAAILLPFWALNYLTADVLFLTLLLAYTLSQVEGRFYGRPYTILFYGALLYLAKAYGLVFFVGHNLVMGVVYFFNGRRGALGDTQGGSWRSRHADGTGTPRRQGWGASGDAQGGSSRDEPRRRTVVGFGLVVLVCSSWIALISAKQGQFTISEAGPYNRSINSSGKIVHPCDTLGLLPLLPGERYFAWEEMTRHVLYPMPAMNFVSAITHNTPVLARLLMKAPRYGLALCVLLGIYFLLFKKRPPPDTWVLLSALLVFVGGYCLLFVEERYLPYPVLLLALLIVVALQLVATPLPERWHWLPAIIAFYILARPAVDAYRFTNITDETISAQLGSQLDDHRGRQIRFASWQPYQFTQLAYYKGWKDFGGLVGYGNDSVRMADDLQRLYIDMIVLPKDVQLPRNVESRYRPVKDVHDDRVRVLMR